MNLYAYYFKIIPFQSWCRFLSNRMPKKIRELIRDLKNAGFKEVPGGKGSHRKYTHANYLGAVTVSGKSGDDAKKYQEKQTSNAIESVKS